MKAAEVVLLRCEFYKDRYKHALIYFIVMLLLNIGMGALVAYTYIKPRGRYYIPATNDFRLLNIHPLSDPVVNDEWVQQWATNAVLSAYNIDYIHWQQEMQVASANFTDDGWNTFLDKFKEYSEKQNTNSRNKFKSSNNLSSILKMHMIADTSITGAAQIQAKGLLPSGYYAWKIQVPVLVTYIGNSTTIRMPESVTLLVVRQPVNKYPDRIAINNFIASTQGS